MIINQAQLFLIFVINGLIIGLLFDFFRILRKTIKTNDIITYIEDILFWILTGFIILFSTFTFNNGEIRLFMFIGILIGVGIYMLSFSKYIIKINVIIINIVKSILIKILKTIIAPLKLLKKIILKPITFIFINFKKISTKLTKNIKIKQKNLIKKKEIGT